MKCQISRRLYLIRRRSPPARVVWIEIRLFTQKNAPQTSPPARVVWIEIVLRRASTSGKPCVATREGGVD